MKLLLICVIVLCMTSMLRADAPTTAPSLRIVLVGDSTVNDAGGWGPGFKAMLTSDVECINTAKNGRSSKSFRDEGHWKTALATKANYVLIQFGHNDQPGKGPERETDAATTFPENLKRYVEEARAAGMTPILVTSLTRRKFDDKGKIKDDLHDYVEATRKVAAELKVPLLDLNKLSMAYCESIGEEGCKELSATDKNGGVDRTHLNGKGGMVFGKMVAIELPKIEPDLASHIQAESKDK